MTDPKLPQDLVSIRDRFKAVWADIHWLAGHRPPETTSGDVQALLDTLRGLAEATQTAIDVRMTRAFTKATPELDKFLEGVVGIVECDGSEDYHHAYERNKASPNLGMTWEQPRNEMTSVVVGEIDGRPVNVSLRIAVIGGHRILFCWGCSMIVDHGMIRSFLDIVLPETQRNTGSSWHHSVPRDDNPETGKAA